MSSAPIDEVPGIADSVEIGAGGFGTVFRAQQPSLQRTVAVKILHDSVSDERIRTRFEREAQAMGKLSGHPNIVVVHEGGVTASGHPYIVMAHEAQGSLADRLSATGPMPWQEVAEAGVRLAGALQTAHDAGILHRDLKPANVLVNAYGEVRLADFGIARLSGTAATTTSAGVTASIAHAPPEVLDGADPTAASDVFSLASTLHTLLRGAPPFLRDTDQSIIQVIGRLVTEDPPPLPVDVPAAVGSVIVSGLGKRPEDRPASAEAFGRLLQDAQREVGLTPTVLPVQSISPRAIESLQPDTTNGNSTRRLAPDVAAPTAPLAPVDGPPSQQPPSPVPAEAPPSQTARWLLPILGVLGVILLGVAGVALLGGDPDEEVVAEPAPTVGEGEAQSPGTGATEPSEVEATSVSEGPAWLASLPEVLYLSFGGDIQAGLYRHAPEGRQLLQAGVFSEAQPQPGASAVLLSASTERDVNLLQLYQGASELGTVFFGAEGQFVGAAHWAPDGSFIAIDVISPEGGDEIWVASPDGTNTRPVFNDPGVQLSFPAPFTPDGSQVVLAAGPPDEPDGGADELWLFDVADFLAGTEEQPLVVLPGFASSFSPDGRTMLVQRNEPAGPVVDRYMDGQLAATVPAFEVNFISWAPDSSFFLTSSGDGSLLRFDDGVDPVAITGPDRVSRIGGVTEQGIAVYIDFEGDLMAIDVHSGEEVELDGIGGLDSPALRP